MRQQAHYIRKEVFGQTTQREDSCLQRYIFGLAGENTFASFWGKKFKILSIINPIILLLIFEATAGIDLKKLKGFICL